jgi:hypothetical protein
VFVLPVRGQTEPQAVRASTYAGLALCIVGFAFIQEDFHQNGMIVVGLQPTGPGLTGENGSGKWVGEMGQPELRDFLESLGLVATL